MITWDLIQSDYDAEVAHSGYQGDFKKWFHAVTSPGFQAAFGYRVTHALYRHNIPFLGMIIQRLVEVWCGVSISPKAKIGPSLVIYHFGGIVINGAAVLGSGCRIHHGVTIGNRKPGGGAPHIGNNVMFGAGAKVLGEIKIGNHVDIGANAVVTQSAEDGAVLAGVPAKVLRIKTISEPKADA